MLEAETGIPFVATKQPATPDILASEIVDRLTYRIGKDPKSPSRTTGCSATILVVRDRIIDHWMESTRAPIASDAKRVYYLSLEFLIGRLMRDAISNLGLLPQLRRRWRSSASTSTCIAALEPDAALGNGGLGRLAACFMESMATRRRPRLRLRHPLRSTACSARRSPTAGRSNCRRTGSSTAIPGSSSGARAPTRSASAASVESGIEADGDETRYVWQPAERVIAHRLRHADRRLARQRASTRCACGRRSRSIRSCSTPSTPATTSARSSESNRAEALTRVLYPADATPAGQELRLRQEYLLLLGLAAGHPAPPPAAVSATLDNLPDKVAIQLNDTHPAICGRRADAPADRRPRLEFDKAWELTQRRLRLHQPHAAARGAGELAGAAVRARCCRATCRSSTRSTPSVLREAREAGIRRRADLAASR